MKTTIRSKSKIRWVTLVLALGFVALLSNAVPALAQQQLPPEAPQRQMNQAGPQGDPIRQLDLTPDQIAKIRAIREQAKDERFAVNQRLRQAQSALDEAIEADNATEAQIEQRAKELSEAQVAATRMRALTELRIRRVMTAEQLTKLRTLRQQAQQFRQDRQDRQDRREQGPGDLRPRDRRQRGRDALQPDDNQRPGGMRPPAGFPPAKQRP
jgi:Spy/CpxP family protein refolding chaperone